MRDDKTLNWLEQQFDQAVELNQSISSESIENELISYNGLSKYTDKVFVTHGGMKDIYKVYDQLTGRTIAMAELREPNNKVARELFIREAQINSILQHPNIIQVYEFDFNEDGNPYFAMKFLEGLPLNKFLRTINPQHHRTLLLSKFISICEAVAYAHSRGVMHLDLKPENIWVGKFGEVLIIDWGLARISELDCDDYVLESNVTNISNATILGIVRGTLGFMSPEQAVKDAVVSYKSDIFSLGAILFNLLTGKPPFTGKSQNELINKTKIAEWDKKSASGLPKSLVAIISKAMSKKLQNRYKSASEMAKDISSYLDGFSPSAEKAGILKKFSLMYRRNLKLFNLAVVSAISVGSIAYLANFLIKEFSHEAHKQTLIAKEHAAIAEQKNMELIAEKKEKMLAGLNLLNEAKEKAKSKFGYKGALQLLKESYEFGYETNETHYYFSGLYMSKGEFVKSRKHLTKAIKMSKPSTPLYQKSSQALNALNSSCPNNNFSKANIEQFYASLLSNQNYFFSQFVDVYISKRVKTIKQRITDLKYKLKKFNRHSDLNIRINKVGNYIKIDLSNNGSKLVWAEEIHRLPVVELTLRNSRYEFIDYMHFHHLKTLDIRGTKVKTLKYIKSSPIQKLFVSEGFADGFKELPSLLTLKEVYVPKSFQKQDKVVNQLKKRGVEVIFEK